MTENHKCLDFCSFHKEECGHEELENKYSLNNFYGKQANPKVYISTSNFSEPII